MSLDNGFIVPVKHGDLHLEKHRPKTCSFPGCGKEELMTGQQTYCTEHRRDKYIKIKRTMKRAEDKRTETIQSANYEVVNKLWDTLVQTHKCQLDGCNNAFEVRIVSGINILPRFCNEHRNEWKREFFLQQQRGKTNVRNQNPHVCDTTIR